MPGDSMVTLQRVDASIAPLALLRKELLIPRIWLKQPNASLERPPTATTTGRLIWPLADPQQPPSARSFTVHDIVFDKGQIAFKDAALKADFRAVIDPLGKPLPFSEVTGNRAAARPLPRLRFRLAGQGQI